MSEELKPCPFCGAPAHNPENEAKITQRAVWAIRCSQHCVTMRRSRKGEVIGDWNSRVIGQADR